MRCSTELLSCVCADVRCQRIGGGEFYRQADALVLTTAAGIVW